MVGEWAVVRATTVFLCVISVFGFCPLLALKDLDMPGLAPSPFPLPCACGPDPLPHPQFPQPLPSHIHHTPFPKIPQPARKATNFHSLTHPLYLPRLLRSMLSFLPATSPTPHSNKYTSCVHHLPLSCLPHLPFYLPLPLFTTSACTFAYLTRMPALLQATACLSLHYWCILGSSALSHCLLPPPLYSFAPSSFLYLPSMPSLLAILCLCLYLTMVPA